MDITQAITTNFRLSQALEKYAYVLFLVTLAWAPFPLGSNRPWSWSLLEVLTIVIFNLWLASYLIHSSPLPKALHAARIPLILFSVWLFYLLLQTVAFPPGFIQTINSAGYNLYQYTLGLDNNIPISLDPGTSMIEFIKSASYVLAFFLTLVLINSRQRLKTLAWMLFIVGFIQALYAILTGLGGDLFWNPSPGSVSGTYINRNHFAGLMEMTIPLGIALFIYKLGRPSYAATWKQRLNATSKFLLHKRSITLVMILVMVGALLLSASRGGNISLVIAFAVVLLLSRIKRGKSSQEARLIPWVIIVAVIAGSWFGVSSVTDRLDQGLDTYRTQAWQGAAQIFYDYPLTGVGNGGYESSFQLYRDEHQDTVRQDHAHNDYLEFISQQGLIGFILFFAAILYIVVAITKAYIIRRDPLMVGLQFAALVSFSALLMHSFVDFNFQIPANAYVFLVLLSLGMVAATAKFKT